METKKKHNEEVAELNQQIDFVFGTLPTLLQNSIQDAIDQLLVLEKKSRLLLEPLITIRITDKILDICFESQNFVKLNSSIVLLSKRRSQHDDVIASLVKKSMNYLEQIKDYDTKMELLKTLLETSEGKIFLEVNRAQLIRELMRMRESVGDLEGAAAASQEIQVEVCNALSSYEKAEFLIEQIRLCQAVGDWVRVPITIQKVNTKVLKEEGHESLIEEFIKLCIVQHLHDVDYLALYYDYEQYLSLSRFEEDDSVCLPIIEILCILCVLIPYGDEQQLLLRSITKKYNRFWKYIESSKLFIWLFNQRELIQWPLCMNDVIQSNELFKQQKGWSELLRKRVIEHNIRVLGEYMTECSIDRVGELLQISGEEAEQALADACIDGMTWLRMDRIQRTVCFQQHRPAETVLTNWTQDVKTVMEGLDKIVYLIEKEKMLKEVM